jgi:hypothetical protein
MKGMQKDRKMSIEIVPTGNLMLMIFHRVANHVTELIHVCLFVLVLDIYASEELTFQHFFTKSSDLNILSVAASIQTYHIMCLEC